MNAFNKTSHVSEIHSHQDVVHLVQLTDCHLGMDAGFNLAGVNTHQTLSQILSEVVENRTGAFAMVTGDIACRGAAESYHLFSGMMATAQLSYHWLPGNHDNFQQMQKNIPQPFVKDKVFGRWVAISLVSSVAGQVNGELSDSELQALSTLLEKHKDRYVLLFVHHPPVKIQCQWLDKQRIANSDKLHQVIASAGDQVKGIFTGHVHQETETDWFGSPVYTTPSTCFQFARKSVSFDLSDMPPGYRWIELHGNGTLKTGIEYLAGYVQQIDRSCIGY